MLLYNHNSNSLTRPWAVITFVCIISINIAVAQSSHQIFEHLTTDHGLSSNKAEAILQDRDGFYWIATQNGLNRFDGTSFKIYRNNSTDSSSISHNYCTALVEGKNGDIWIATYKGVSRFIKSADTFQRVYLQHPSRNFEITNRIYSLATDQEGNIWIAGNGLWKYDVKRDSVFLFKNSKTDLSSIPFYSLITRLVYDPKLNGLWFITGNDLVFYTIQENAFYYKLHNPKSWKVFDHADSREITLDKKNRLWFRDLKSQVLAYFESDQNKVTLTSKKIDQGVKHISPDDKNRIWIFYWLAKAEIFDPLTNTSDSDFFSRHHRRSALSEQGTYLFIDKEKNHWIASGNGISIYNEFNQYYKLHEFAPPREDSRKEPVKVNAIAQNEPGYLWVATNAGLYKYNFSNSISRRVNNKALSGVITTIYSDAQKLWIGLHDHLICMDAGSEAIIKDISIAPGIFFIEKGNDDDLWIGLWAGGLYRLNSKTFALTAFKQSTNRGSLKSNSLITGMHDDGYIWVGYNAGIGFSKYSMDDQLWTHYHPQENDQSNSNAGTITVIAGDRNDLWLGTHGSGIFRFDPVGNQYINFDQSQGLNSNYINSILPDNTGSLWVSTADGINYLDSQTKTVRSLDIGLVFSENDFVANGIEGLNGKLYFFCKNEFAEIDPSSFRPANQIPQLVFSNFKIFDKDVALPVDNGRINLTHRQNFFSFEFSSIKTHPFKKISYAYQLKGFDKDWNITDHQNSASYTNVPHGHYVFMVKAKNDDGEWTDALGQIPIHIRPPFWKTWWFIFLSAAVIITAIYGFYRYRIQQVKKIYSVRAKISQDLHDDIGASLSSIHFNSSIAEQQVKNNPDKAKEILRQINRNTRQVIEDVSDIVWANHSDKKEKYSLAGRIKNYGYDLLSQKNIDCKYSIDAQAEKKLSNPEARRNILLIIKEAMNNIAKYSGADHAEVSVAVYGPDLSVSISDNGKGFDPDSYRESNGHGNGLSNMKKRTESIGGHFDIQSSEGRGTSIHCLIPLPNISEA